jgi:dephospho-CoA kinase
MQVIGLTGGIGCGKSTVSALLAERDVAVIDADRIARDVVDPGTDGLAEVVRAFGPSVLDSDGMLDRKRLGTIVFSDEAKRRELNALLHPRIAAESARRIFSLGEQGAAWCVYEAALLVENGTHRSLPALIVVTARPDVQLARVMARDGATQAEALSRIGAQLPLADKVAVAQYVVDNSGTMEQLRNRTADLYAELVREYGPPRVS